MATKGRSRLAKFMVPVVTMVGAVVVGLIVYDQIKKRMEKKQETV